MANGELVKLGTLYLAGVKQARPTYPWRNDSGQNPPGSSAQGNIPNYSSGNIEIRDTDSSDAYKLQWRKVTVGGKDMLICDRNILVNVQWDQLHAQSLVFGKTITIDGQQYKIRCLTGGTASGDGGGTPANEWDNIIGNVLGLSGLPTPTAEDLNNSVVAADLTSTHNQFWNWDYCYSWCQDTYASNSAARAVRGYSGARNWSDNHRYNGFVLIGFRPALEILNTAPLISDNDGDLGNFSAPLKKTYSVSEADGDFFSIFEQLDGSTIRNLSNQSAGSFSIDLTSQWGGLAIGQHTLKVTATDIYNAASVRTWTFRKTNSQPGKPTITGLANGQRIEQSLDIMFSPTTDPDGDAQTFAVEVADDAAFSSGKQTFTTGLKKYNTGSKVWESATTASNADAGASFKIPVSGLTLNSDKYIRVSSTDKSGSNTTVYSNTLQVRVGTVLEVQSLPAPLDYQPTSAMPRFSMVVDSRAAVTVMVCNNALDDAPAWEDATTDYAANRPHTFTNKTKTALQWAVSLKLKIEANDSTGEISVSAVGMGVM